MERDKEDLLLLFDHDGELALLFSHVLDHFIIRRAALCLLQIFTLLFELAYAHNVALDLVVNDSHRSVSDLVIREELMELGEVRVRLEDVQEVESQVDRLLVIIAEGAGNSAKQCLVVEHDLHVLVREAEVEK